MNESEKSIISTAINLLQNSLRQTSQKFITDELMEEIMNLRLQVWQEPTITQILSPFNQVIVQPKSTDAVTLSAVRYLDMIIQSGLIKKQDDMTLLINSLTNCHCQATLEEEFFNLSVHIFMVFRQLVSQTSIPLSLDSIEKILEYCQDELLQREPTALGADYIASIFEILLQTLHTSFPESYNKFLVQLFNIAKPNNWDITANAALRPLLRASTIDAHSSELMSIVCVLFHSYLSQWNSMENFVLALRLFFSFFKDSWQEFLGPFQLSIKALLEFINSPKSNKAARANAYEIFIDFFSLPSFSVDFFSSYYSLSSVFPDILNTVLQSSSASTEYTAVSLSIIMCMLEAITTSDTPSELDTEDDHQFLSNLQSFTEEFNNNPKTLFSQSLSPHDVALNIFISPNSDPKVIGDFFAIHKDFVADVTQEYLKLFDFGAHNFDESIRMFLTSFRIAGESQIIDRIFDQFSQAFAKSHPNEYSPESIHILSFAWMMLHTASHNPNADKMTLPQFFKLLKDQNQNKDFDSQFLTNIYQSVIVDEISNSPEKDKLSKSYWVLYQRRYSLLVDKIHIPKGLGKQLFQYIWQTATPILISLFEHQVSNDILSYLKKCAYLSNQFGLSEILDKIIVNLSLFVTRLSGKQARDSLVAIFEIVCEYGSRLQNGWKNVVNILLQLFREDLLPESLRQVNSKFTIIHTNSHKHRKSFIQVFFNLGNEKDSESETTNDGSSNFIQTLKIESIFDTIPGSSLGFLIDYFSQAALDSITDSPSEAALCIHLLTRICISNPQGLLHKWEMIEEPFSAAFSKSKVQILLLASVYSTFNLLTSLFSTNLKHNLMELLAQIMHLSEQEAAQCNSAMIDGVTQFLDIHLKSFVSQFEYAPVLFVLDHGLHENSATPQLFHSIVIEFGQHTDIPDLNRFNDFYLPFLKVAIRFLFECGDENYFEKFVDLNTILGMIRKLQPNASIIELIFDKVFYPVLALIPALLGFSDKHHTTKMRATLIVKCVFQFYLASFHTLEDTPSLEKVWYLLIHHCISLMQKGSNDMNETIPELLGNAMTVMVSSKVFDDGENAEILQHSRSIIEPLSPEFSEFCQTYFK